MAAPNILPAVASPTGNYRGICDWADRPMTFNSGGADGFIYVCVATDTWQRVAIATWA